MVVAEVTGVAGLMFSYLIYKQQTLRTPGQLKDEIEKRLQPKYPIAEPLNSEVMPHTEWPSSELYFEVWHVEVIEQRWGRSKKWLPFGEFQGSTIVKYKLHGSDAPEQSELRKHHLAAQPYIRSIERMRHNPKMVKVIYESTDPSDISLFATQFKHLITNTLFRQLNPDVDIRYEVVSDGDGGLYGRIFDANISEPLSSEES